MPCMLPFLHGLWVMQDRRCGQLFDGGVELLQGIASALGSCLQLTAVCCSLVLVPKAVLKGLYSFFVHLFFRDSVEDI